MIKMDKEQQAEALRALVMSDGWAVLREHALVVHNPENVMTRLTEAMRVAPDAETFGLKSAIITAESNAVRGMLELPMALVEVFTREEGK